MMVARPRDPAPQPTTVRWPGGPYDFVLQDATVDEDLTRRLGLEEGWLYIKGLLVEPYRDSRTFYVQQLGDREYALKPKQAWTGVPADRSRPQHGDHVAEPSHLRA